MGYSLFVGSVRQQQQQQQRRRQQQRWDTEQALVANNELSTYTFSSRVSAQQLRTYTPQRTYVVRADYERLRSPRRFCLFFVVCLYCVCSAFFLVDRFLLFVRRIDDVCSMCFDLSAIIIIHLYTFFLYLTPLVQPIIFSFFGVGGTLLYQGETGGLRRNQHLHSFLKSGPRKGNKAASIKIIHVSERRRRERDTYIHWRQREGRSSRRKLDSSDE